MHERRHLVLEEHVVDGRERKAGPGGREGGREGGRRDGGREGGGEREGEGKEEGHST